MFDAASGIRIECLDEGNGLEHLMACTMFDVPALDVVRLTLAVSTGLQTPVPLPPICVGSEKRCS